VGSNASLKFHTAHQKVNFEIKAVYIEGRKGGMKAHPTRFFKDLFGIGIRPNKFAYLSFILAMLPAKEKLSPVMDSTNWKFGSVHINILLLTP
jgi:hypothetical protein